MMEEASLGSKEQRETLSLIDLAALPGRSRRRKLLGFGYHWSLSMVAMDVLTIAQRKLGDDRVQFVFDEQKGLEGASVSLF
jgi:hypothetical protein